ncbi:VanZ family protein [Paenibacillus sp. NPDC056579]|uniref:VanZ family protein n=1 Tax=Paenibacillus sp. NPDC056579 TaxID=3345871 RepID=UPI003698F0C0
MRPNNLWKMIFIVYVVMLLLFIVIKFGDALETIARIKAGRELGIYNYDFSFRALAYYLKNINEPFAYRNIIGNTVVFVPLGFLIPIVTKKSSSFSRTMFICILSIVGIETFQLVTLVGFFDIADIILNTMGCFIGWMGFRVILGKKHLHRAQRRSYQR